MNTSRLSAGASRFAHFAGLTRASRRAEEEDDQEPKGASEDDDEPRHEDDDPADAPKNGKKGKRSRHAEDEGDDDEPKSKKSRRAEEDDDDDEPRGKKSRHAEGGDEDEDDDDEPRSKGKKSRRAEEDDDEDEDDDKQEMNGRSSASSARRRERARCAAIFAHPSAAGNVALAASLAFETTMTRKEAIAVLRGQAGRSPSGGQGASSDRADRNPQLGTSAPSPSRRQAAGSSWDAAFKRAGVKVRG